MTRRWNETELCPCLFLTKLYFSLAAPYQSFSAIPLPCPASNPRRPSPKVSPPLILTNTNLPSPT